MKNKTKSYLFVMVVGVALVVSAFFYKNNKNSDVADIEEDIKQNETVDEEITSGQNYFEGTLLNSDDLGRGNLKLVSDSSEIYVRTERDFSALIGLNVLVHIEGTLDNFKLLNIESKLTKDGFIKSQ